VFRGGTQSGAGLGDMLRGLFRFLMPIALRGIQTFAGNTLAATQAGVPLSLAAKSAIMPTISAVAGSAAPTVSRLMNTVIPGLIPANNTTAQSGSGLFSGQNGIPNTEEARRQYKRAAKSASFEALEYSPAKKKRSRNSAKAHSADTSAHYNF
jgi:hypothetical protein